MKYLDFTFLPSGKTFSSGLKSVTAWFRQVTCGLPVTLLIPKTCKEDMPAYRRVCNARYASSDAIPSQ